MKKFLSFLLIIIIGLFYQNAYSKKAYKKKAPYAGMGKPSKINRLPKTKSINGHGKRTKKGYTYVNPYARSK